MYRRERPQRGRQRQFTQVGVERVGGWPAGGEALAEAETVEMGCRMVARALGVGSVADAGLALRVNTLGNDESRTLFCSRLADYLRPHADSLAPATRARLLRGGAGVAQILESRHAADEEVLAEAPRVLDALDRESIGHFARVRQALDALGVEHSVDARLVRGLAYRVSRSPVRCIQCLILTRCSPIQGA